MKLSIKRVALALSLALATISTSGNALAQDFSESHLEAARKAITASRSSERLDDILPQMAEEAKAELIRTNPDKEAVLTEIVDSVAISFAGRRADLENEIAQIFAKVFSEAELNQIAEFYSSEAGQKFLRESPIVLREMGNAAQVWAGGLKRDMQGAVLDKMIEAGLK